MSDVTQADREAAWPQRSIIYTEGDKKNWMDGAYDRAVPLIRKFAAYRETAYAAGLAAGIAQERERCAEALEALRAYVKAYDSGTGTIHVNTQIRAAIAAAEGE